MNEWMNACPAQSSPTQCKIAVGTRNSVPWKLVWSDVGQMLKLEKLLLGKVESKLQYRLVPPPPRVSPHKADSSTFGYSQTRSMITLFNGEFTQGVSEGRLLGGVLIETETIVLDLTAGQPCLNVNLFRKLVCEQSASVVPMKGIADNLTNLPSEKNWWSWTQSLKWHSSWGMWEAKIFNMRNPWGHVKWLLCPWGFSRQEYWSGLPCPPPRDLPNPGIEPGSFMSPALAGEFFTTSATWEGYRNVERIGPVPWKPPEEMDKTIGLQILDHIPKKCHLYRRAGQLF